MERSSCRITIGRIMPRRRRRSPPRVWRRANSLESAIAATLPPGLYTALLAGRNNGTGIGIVEIYDRGPEPPAP